MLIRSSVAIYSAGAGGNYILDATNFLEFLPSTHAWLVTFMATWWAVGYTGMYGDGLTLRACLTQSLTLLLIAVVTGLIAWGFVSTMVREPGTRNSR